jgi:hypothetical protein
MTAANVTTSRQVFEVAVVTVMSLLRVTFVPIALRAFAQNFASELLPNLAKFLPRALA